MANVVLIYDGNCPNVELARDRLRRALRETAQPPQWREWNRGDASSPAFVRQYGSPTILVDGKDVAGANPVGEGECCRLYGIENGAHQRAPSAETIVTALRSAPPESRGATQFRSLLAVVPAAGAAMLPALACPACWPAYAGLLSSAGLGFLTQSAHLLPLTVVLLLVAIGPLAFHACTRRRFGPLMIGVVAAALIVVGKFAFVSNVLTYLGIAALISASMWNGWPKRAATSSCMSCTNENNEK